MCFGSRGTHSVHIHIHTTDGIQYTVLFPGLHSVHLHTLVTSLHLSLLDDDGHK